MLTVGIDTGGTFTDFTVGDRVLKVRSTPEDPARSVLEGLRQLGLDGPFRIVYGTTVATNALLTRTVARTALLTTAGVEDLIEIGRQDREQLYSSQPRKPQPLVARADRIGVTERILADGSVDTPLDLDNLDLEGLTADRSSEAIEAIAVCLLHAYRNPAHEQALGEALKKTGLPVSLSHRVCNEFREFERAATTVANASLMPVVGPYISRLHCELVGHTLEILQSNGGTATPEEIMREPVRTVLSGPAGGVVATAELARMHGVLQAVSFDMGGTSTDVSLVAGETKIVPQFVLEGMPLRVPVVDVHTVGAGGGSIARLDALGALRVGPQSAGAVPGPACYGVGEEPTVTDAHVVLGHLKEIAGGLTLDADRARAAVGEDARDILRVANATMERAIRQVTVRRGIDPRPCTLIAYGGAGGLHATDMAEALGMTSILIPPDPGTFSAHGMRTADRRRDFVQTLLVDAEDFEPQEHATIDARYAGQSHELSVIADDDFRERFHAAHEEAYGYCDRSRRIEIVNLRRTEIEVQPKPPPHAPRERATPRSAPARMRREELDVGSAVFGPTILDEVTATTIVPDGWQVQKLVDGTLLLEPAK